MTRERVNRLRGLMEKHGIDAYLIPSTDAHQSEYVPDAWQRRPWISGFTGSAGDVIVARSTAGLWTDSRYYLQAEKELAGTGIKLFKKGLIDVPDMLVWVADTLKPGQVFGADPALVSYEMANRINGTLAPRGIQILWLESNLIDALWEKRPGLPFRPISVQRLEYAGESAEEKLGRLRERMKTEGAGIHILTTLDAIAWLFNIRGGDVAYNPVAVAFAVVTDRDAHLFIGQGEGDESLSRHLEGIAEIHPYENCKGMISACARTGEKIWLDPLTASQWIVDVIGDTGQITFKESPVTLFKAVKNQVEIEGFIRAHRRDGLAMVRFLNWLAQSVPAGGVTEISASKKLASLRAELPLYQGPSFRTISAYGDHGAIVHYSSTPATDCELKPEGLYLVDSGAHYLDGTTDITRTIALGPPTEEQRDRFTRVLKGHIILARTCFPRGTRGIQLDTLARKPQWDIGLNYGHGTGHGIGSYLNVHEGPQSISISSGTEAPLEKGMCISIEPGYYKEGEYGIRIENLAFIKPDEARSRPSGEFLCFEYVTLCPIDLNCVEIGLLSRDEIGYLNDYHGMVWSVLSPSLEGTDVDFLKDATRPV